MHSAQASNGAPVAGRTPIPARALSAPQSAIVLGAGVVGMATAYALARRGVQVTVVDACDAPGCGASFANGAQLSYAYTEALASPALLQSLPMMLLGKNSAIRFHPALDISQWQWLLRFLRNASPTRFRSNTLAGLELGLESQVAMKALQNRHALDFGHVTTGKLHIYDNDLSLSAALEILALKRSFGAVQEAVSAEEARAIEPALIARRAPVAGAVWSPQEEVGDPYRFCTAMMALLTRDYGVTMRLGTTVLGLDGHTAAVMTAQGEQISADDLVICAGIGSLRFARKLGLRARLQPMKGYSLTVQPGPSKLTVSVTDVSRKVVLCPLGGAVRIAGIAELGTADTTVEPAALAQLKATAQDCLPDVGDYTQMVAGWSGIRPMSANSLPQIGRVAARVAVNIGHGMLGWTFAMGSGERLAAVLLDGGI